jgi:hypothetical protein
VSPLAVRPSGAEQQGPAGRGFRGMIANVYRDRFGEEVMEADLREP